MTTTYIVCMIKLMDITFDPDKSAKNIAERGISFESAAQFDFSTAMVAVDDRYDYGETRYIAVGLLGVRLHAVVFTETGVPLISLRKVN